MVFGFTLYESTIQSLFLDRLKLGMLFIGNVSALKELGGFGGLCQYKISVSEGPGPPVPQLLIPRVPRLHNAVIVCIIHTI